MNWRSIKAIVIKDLKEVRQNKAAWMPAIIVPLFFTLLLPILFIVLPQVIPMEDIASEFGELQTMVALLPPAIAQAFEGLGLEQMWVVYSTGYMLAPLFLIMPLMFSSIVGAESFVGERERKTMEALLYTPTSDAELFLGKVLAAVLPSIGLSWLSYLLYTLVVNAASYQLMGRIWFPLPAWWPLMFWVTPAFAVLGVSATVLVSSRVRTFMEAYQLSASLVVLVLGLVAGQISGVLSLGVVTSLIVGFIIWLLAVVLLYISIDAFKRSRLIAQL